MTEQIEGQLTMTDFLQTKIIRGEVKAITAWINSQGKAQYTQIREVVSDIYECYKESDELVARITNAVSVYVLDQSLGYMQYLKSEAQ